MGPAVYIMAILGCGEGEAACQQVGTVRARYESAAECNADTMAAVERNMNIAYPVVVAECRRAGQPASAELKASDVQLPPPSRGTGDRVRIARSGR